MKIAIYSRKSKWTGQGDSIKNQVKICQEYIASYLEKKEKAEIIIYEDEGFSGKSTNRPQFQKMMTQALEKKLDYIVCYRLDRISRNVGDFSALIEKLNEKGVAFVCVKEQFDTKTPMGRAMMYIASVFAQLERETLGERVRDNMLFLSRSGRWLGGTTPMGFTCEKKEAEGKRSSQLKENPQELEKVALFYDLFLKKNSLAYIERYCQSHGITGRQGNRLSRQGIREILSNPVYCKADKEAKMYFVKLGAQVCFEEEENNGLIAYNKRNYHDKSAPRHKPIYWIVAQGAHKGLICGKDWVYVQEKLKENGMGAPKTRPHNTYACFSGKILCKNCGKTMISKKRSSSNPNAFDYICSEKIRSGLEGCSIANLPGEKTDQLLIENMLPYIHLDKSVFPQLEQLRKEIQQETKEETKEKEIKEMKKELSSLLTLCTRPEVGKALLLQMNKKAEQLQEKIELWEMKQKEMHLPAQQRQKIAFSFQRIPHFFDILTVEEKREVLNFFIKEILWDGKKLIVHLRT